VMKNALRRELVEAVFANDDTPASRREQVFKELSESQWPQYATLETLAEEIRRAAAALAPPPLPALPPIPAALASRFDNYKRDLFAFHDEEMARVRALPPIPAAKLAGVT